MEKRELYHHGVKGMRWGVRRDRQNGSTQRVMSDDAKEVAALRKKKVSEMSNAELQKLNNRIQLEQNYHRLNPTLVRRGMKFVGGAATTMGTVLTLYNNSDKIMKNGRKIGAKLLKATKKAT